MSDQKSYVTIAIFILLIVPMNNLFAKGWNRQVDGKVHFLIPTERDVILTPGVLRIEFSYINQGPDKIFPTDTIRYELSHSKIEGKDRPITKKVSVGIEIDVNDSIVLSDVIKINNPEDVDEFYIGFRKPPKAYGGAFSNYSILWSETSETLEDNKPILIVRLTNNVGINDYISEGTLFLSANPTSQRSIKLKGQFNTNSLQSFDNLGRRTDFELQYLPGDDVTTVIFPDNVAGMIFIYVRRQNEMYSYKVVLL